MIRWQAIGAVRVLYNVKETSVDGGAGVHNNQGENRMSPNWEDMSIEERLALAQQLWDSVATDLERQPLTTAQRTELERRIAEADANPAEGVPWEVVRAEARARWQQ
jgi:putative addiction module component (TIGR02574 family)